MHEDEFSKKSLIGEEEEYTDMSNMVEEFGSDLEQNDLNSIFDTLKKNTDWCQRKFTKLEKPRKTGKEGLFTLKVTQVKYQRKVSQ